MPESSTPYTIRVHLDTGETVTSAQYRYDIPGEAIKEWQEMLLPPLVVVKLVGGWAIIPTARVVELRILPDPVTSPFGQPKFDTQNVKPA